MKKWLRWLDLNFEAFLMVLFFIGMTFLVTLQVILRFVFHSGFSWGEEVARILFVWMAFISFGYLTRNGRHVKVEFLADKLPEHMRKILLFLCDLFFLIFTVKGLFSVIRLCLDAAKYQDTLMSVPWNYNVLYLAGCLGFFLMVLRNIQVLIWKLCHWNSSMERFINYDGLFYTEEKLFFAPAEVKKERTNPLDERKEGGK